MSIAPRAASLDSIDGEDDDSAAADWMFLTAVEALPTKALL